MTSNTKRRCTDTTYGTCHNKVTVLRPCNGYGRSTGTGTGVARLYVATYERTVGTATGV